MLSITAEEVLNIRLPFLRFATSAPCGCRDFLDLIDIVVRVRISKNDANYVSDEQIKS